MRKWLLLLGFLLILPACASETRVYVTAAGEQLRMVIDNCPGVTITGRKEGSDYTLSINRDYSNRFLTKQSVTVWNAKSDVIFTDTSNDLTDLILSACETIHDR